MTTAKIAHGGRVPDALAARQDHRFCHVLASESSRQVGTSLGLALATTRTAVGAVTLFAPSLAHLWVGPAAQTNGGKVLARSLAARDIALGVGALLSAKRPKRLRRWVALAAVGDLVDALGTITGGVPSRPRVVVSAFSFGAVAAGLVAVSQLSPAK